MLVNSVLVNFGLSEDMYNPVSSLASCSLIIRKKFLSSLLLDFVPAAHFMVSIISTWAKNSFEMTKQMNTSNHPQTVTEIETSKG